jgi:HPt (histidine-containing phosphotransfer) domain-containing protein
MPARLDLSYLRSVAGDDEEFVKEMLSMFLNTSPIELNNIETHYQGGNLQMMASCAHKIKAPVQMIGEPILADLILQIETIGKKGEGHDRLPDLIEKLKAETALVIKEVEEAFNNM